MNIIDIQDQLKNFSEQQLISEMQMPTGSAPQFLILSEIKRRKRVRDDFMKREAANQPTVAEEAISAAGVPQSGIRGMSEAMAPQAAVAEGGIGSIMPQSMRPQTMPAPTDDAIPMAEGGVIRAANGLPLGLRQNNPGNIRPGAGFYGETGEGGGYATFGSEDEGLRAIARLLGTYDDEYGINTLRGLTSRYAPRSDNKLSYDNYLSYLSSTLGLDPDEEFDLKGRRGDLIPAIIGFEQGRDYEDRYSDDQISRAIRAAGTEDEAEIAEILAGGDEPGLMSKLGDAASSVLSAINPISTAQAQTTASTPQSMYPDAIIRAAEAGASDGAPSQAEIRARVDQMKRDAGLGEYKNVDIPNLGGSGVVIQDIGDAAEAAAINAQTAQSQVITSAEQGVAPAQLADLADDAGAAVEKAATVQSFEKDIQANNAREAALTKMREAEAAKAKEEELRKIAETAPPSVAAGLLEEADAQAALAAQLTEQAGQDNTEGAALEAAATEQRESKQPDPGTTDITPPEASDPAADERGEGDDETATDSDEPNVSFSNRSESDGAPSSLQQEILDLQKKLERDRDTDKYLALAQAGLALMSSKDPTLLGAIGEAGVSGLQAYREAQDRYNEGVVDLINARAKLAKGDDGLGAFKGDAGNAVARLGQIRRALSGADGMTLSDEERTRLLQERVFLQRALGIPEYTAGATSAAPAS